MHRAFFSTCQRTIPGGAMPFTVVLIGDRSYGCIDRLQCGGAEFSNLHWDASVEIPPEINVVAALQRTVD
jgi:TPP-dependent trihydroxycyclohexane-1,2-dione (THcHDO) dehydratase